MSNFQNKLDLNYSCPQDYNRSANCLSSVITATIDSLCARAGAIFTGSKSRQPLEVATTKGGLTQSEEDGGGSVLNHSGFADFPVKRRGTHGGDMPPPLPPPPSPSLGTSWLEEPMRRGTKAN
jgi:hypothetical protein